MASPFEGWDDQQMLDQYLYDYFIKRKLHKTAAIFREQANVATKPVEINDSAQGFLYDWWTMFYDVYAYRQSGKRQDVKGKAPVNVMAEQMSQNEERNAYQIVPQLTINKQRHGQFPFGRDFYKVLEQPGASLIAARMFEEQCHPVRNYDPQLQAFDVNKLNLSNSALAISSYLPLQAPQLFLRDNRSGISAGRATPLRTNPYGAQTGMGDPWLSPSYLEKFPLSMQQYQPSLWAQALSSTSENLRSASPGSSANFQAQNLILPKSNLNMKDAQLTIQMKQTQEKQNQHAQCLEQQLSENDRKRKRLSYSRAEGQTLDSVNAEEDKSANEDVESFLSTDDDHGDGKGTHFSTLKRRSTACSDNDHKRKSLSR